jgi:chromosome partitioning protein
MRTAEIAAFLNQKGGVGKTTSVVNIGAGLAILGKKVLIVDLDPQAHLTGYFGIETNEINKTIFDVLRGKADLRESLVKKDLRARFHINGEDSRISVQIAPSDFTLTDAEIVLSSIPEREFSLKKAIDIHQDEFDYILIDCPPSLGLLSTNALVASKKVYIPVQTEHLALESLGNLHRTIESTITRLNPDLEIGGLIATRFDGRKNLNRAVVETLKERFGSLFLESMIRENIVLAEAPSAGKDIFSYRSRSYGAQDYLDLCQEILDRSNSFDAHYSLEPGRVVTKHPISEASLG